MEHTDLTEQQYQVLSALGEAPIPLDAAALGKKLPLIDAPAQRVALNKLFRLELVERTDTGKGYIYELTKFGEALITQHAKATLSEQQPESFGEEGRAGLPKPNPAEFFINSKHKCLDDAIAASGGTGVDFADGPDQSVEVAVFRNGDGTTHICKAGSVDHLIAAANHEPVQRPDDLDERLAYLERMIEGFRPRFPDVSTDLARVHQLLVEAYPVANPHSTEPGPA